MIWTILAGILLTLGTVSLAKLIIKGIVITFNWLKGKIRERMARKHEDQILVAQNKLKEKMREAIVQEIKEHGTSTMTLDDLDNLYDDDGVVMVDAQGDDIDQDTIEIYTTDQIDEKTKNMLHTHGDLVRVEAS